MRNWVTVALGSALATAVLMGACANDLSKGKRTQDVDVLAAQLAKTPLSAELTISDAKLASCDEGEALRIIDREVNASAAHADELWASCQSLYACSATAVQFLNDAFASGARFKIGYANLKKLKGLKLGAQTGGLYLGKTTNVYLDLSLNTPRVACAMLLHELVHRVDPAAYEGEESLRTEYRAYWYQTAYNDDLLKREGRLGDDVRAHVVSRSAAQSAPPADSDGPSGGAPAIPYHTRESLLRAVAQMYGFEVDLTVLRRYSKLPREQ